jgi:hypothetical protein
VAFGIVEPLAPSERARLDKIVGTLTKLAR